MVADWVGGGISLNNVLKTDPYNVNVHGVRTLTKGVKLLVYIISLRSWIHWRKRWSNR